MAVVLTLQGSRRKPSRVAAVVIHHVVHPHPQQLVALVRAQLRHGGLVPPVALLGAAAAVPGVVGGRHRGGAGAGVDLEALVGGYKGCVGPVCFHAAALCGPIVCVPD